MSGGIEDTIFGNIESGSGESFAGDSTADTVDTGTDVQQDQTEQQLNQRGLDKEEVVDEQPKPDPKQPPSKEEKPKQAPDKEHNRVQAEKRLQSSVDRLRNVNSDLTKHNQELVQQLASVQALNGIPKQFNLSNEEVIGGLEYVALLKENPVKAAQKAIEISLARGANLREIVNDEFVPNVTLGATQRMIDERVRNLQQPQNVEPQEVQAARMKTQQFLADYPDAEQHSEVVAHQMRNIMDGYTRRGVQIDPYVAAEMAWNAIQDYAAKNQLNIGQPLGPQLQARQSPQRRPMPNGGNAPVQSQTRIAPADSSNRDIVRQAMRESGYQI